MFGAIMLRLMTVFLLWLAWSMGAIPWVNMIESFADPAASWWDATVAIGATVLWTLVVAAAAAAVVGLHVMNTIFLLAEIVLGVRASDSARWMATGNAKAEAAFDAIGAALLIWWGLAGLTAHDDEVRVFGGITLAFGGYFALSAALQVLGSLRDATRTLTEWEVDSLQTVSITVAGFASLAIAGLAGARGVDHALPPIRYANDVRPLALGELVDPCTVGECEGRRAFAIRLPASGSAYLRTHDQEDCEFGPWDPEGGPLIGPDGESVHFEYADTWEDWGKIGLWLDGEPGEIVEFAVGACIHQIRVVEVE